MRSHLSSYTVKMISVLKQGLLLISFTICVQALDDTTPDYYTNGALRWSKGDVMVLDTDGTVSDAFGIIVALKAYKRKLGPPIVGIICVRGPFLTVEKVCKNVAKLLQLVGRNDIPIFLGADASLAETPPLRFSSYGSDNFGEVPVDDSLLRAPQAQSGVLALARFAQKYKGKLIVDALGPLTNLVLAQEVDNQFLSNVKVILTSAGCVQGVGDYSPGIESKSFQDAEATRVLFKISNYKKLLQVPYEATYETNKAVPKEFWDKFFALPDKYVQVLSAIFRIYLNNGAGSGIVFGDPLLTSAFLEPSIVKSSIPLRATVNTCGESRGSLLVDWVKKDVNIETSNFLSLRNIDPRAYEAFLMKLFV